MKKMILKLDGLFLTVMGTLAACTDLLGYYTGKGPFGATYFQKSITIGGFEAHCLAAIVGFVFLAKRNGADIIFFNKTAMGVHGLLMISNLIWFKVFIETDTLLMGYITTTVHFLFVTLNAIAIYKSNRSIVNR